ncbi:hypothetical protein RF11_04851 [Thelohanellus kitauei]|uniref:Uncharacterized protein n=1 Tax=Thelohanellus kitauei TaxID=669202 RepID=A0A0C2IMR5_THEKT|nr:hypothetical protein RF11_04851 [Thelohanellus kitauei]
MQRYFSSDLLTGSCTGSEFWIIIQILMNVKIGGFKVPINWILKAEILGRAKKSNISKNTARWKPRVAGHSNSNSIFTINIFVVQESSATETGKKNRVEVSVINQFLDNEMKRLLLNSSS